MFRQFMIAIGLTAAASAACYDPNSVVAPDDILLLTASPESIPANGFSTSRITARISTSSDRTITITFTNSGGQLSSTAALAADGNGEASVFLQSETTPKTVTVTAEAKNGGTVLASRSLTVRFDAASPDSLIRLSTSAAQVEADGLSSVVIRAEANPAITSRKVSFKTTDGSFAREGTSAVKELNDIATGADGVAQVQLFAPRTLGTALVTATSGGFSASQTVPFVAALPDFVSLSASMLSVSNDSEMNSITLTTKLSRSRGLVTKNTLVEFLAVNDATGETVGRFENVTRSDDSETAKADFHPGTTALTGTATITARVADNNNVLARIKITITP